MPKMKTHKGTAKRIRVTSTGKLRRQSANLRHNFEHKSSRRTRRLFGSQAVSVNDAPRIKRLLNK